MRRTRQSQSQHKNRSKNNFLYRQYDGNDNDDSCSNQQSIDSSHSTTQSNNNIAEAN